MRIVLAMLALALAACASPPRPPVGAPSSPSADAEPAAKTGGCRSVTLHLYGANDDATEVVVVDVDPRRIGLARGERKSFDLASPPEGVKVWLDVYLEPARVEAVHCTKRPTEAQMAERYAATAGTLTIELAADDVVSATVEGATFALEGRPTIEMATRRFDRIRIGALSG